MQKVSFFFMGLMVSLSALTADLAYGGAGVAVSVGLQTLQTTSPHLCGKSRNNFSVYVSLPPSSEAAPLAASSTDQEEEEVVLVETVTTTTLPPHFHAWRQPPPTDSRMMDWRKWVADVFPTQCYITPGSTLALLPDNLARAESMAQIQQLAPESQQEEVSKLPLRGACDKNGLPDPHQEKDIQPCQEGELVKLDFPSAEENPLKHLWPESYEKTTSPAAAIATTTIVR